MISFYKKTSLIYNLLFFFFRVDDVILQVNDVNVENVMHSLAVQALKDSGNSARLVSLIDEHIFDGDTSLTLQIQKCRFKRHYFIFHC